MTEEEHKKKLEKIAHKLIRKEMGARGHVPVAVVCGTDDSPVLSGEKGRKYKKYVGRKYWRWAWIKSTEVITVGRNYKTIKDLLNG